MANDEAKECLAPWASPEDMRPTTISRMAYRVAGKKSTDQVISHLKECRTCSPEKVLTAVLERCRTHMGGIANQHQILLAERLRLEIPNSVTDKTLSEFRKAAAGEARQDLRKRAWKTVRENWEKPNFNRVAKSVGTTVRLLLDLAQEEEGMMALQRAKEGEDVPLAKLRGIATVRLLNALQNGGIDTTKKLLAANPKDFIKMKNFGNKSVREAESIRSYLLHKKSSK